MAYQRASEDIEVSRVRPNSCDRCNAVTAYAHQLMEHLDHQQQITVDLASSYRKSDYKYRISRSEAYASKKNATGII